MGGVAIDLGTLEDVSAMIDRTVADPQLPAIAVASVNLDHIHHFGAGGAAYAKALRDTPALHWQVLLDGAPVAAYLRLRLKENWPVLPGSSVLPTLLEQAAAAGHSVGFLGGSAEMHQKLRAALTQDFPTLQVTGYWAPSRAELTHPESARAIAEEIQATGTQLLVVGLGKPRQEQWIQDYGVQSGARVLLAFGASADFLAGTVERAPAWMQRYGLEWLHRLLSEPKRLSRRYLIEGPQAALQMVRFPPAPAERQPDN